MIAEEFKKIGEYGAAGMYEEPDRSLFYRKALGLRRFFENCELPEYHGELLYPSGKIKYNTGIYPSYLNGMEINYGKVSEKKQKACGLIYG